MRMETNSMGPGQDKICRCSKDEPALLHGALPESPFNCMQCKKSILLNDAIISNELKHAILKWAKTYNSLFTLWSDTTEYREWAKQKLQDEIGSINLEGLQLAQQYNVMRKTYYWMFQDNSDKDYVQPQQCPFCGAPMVSILNNDFKVCHGCRVAYPDKQTSNDGNRLNLRLL